MGKSGKDYWGSIADFIMTSSRFISMSAYFTLFLGCLLGIYLAANWAMGDLYGYKARYAVDAWQSRKTLPTQDELQSGITDIDKALRWEPRNPEYVELKARILYLQALNSGLETAGFGKIQEAKYYHLYAIELRPNWPYSWANLVLMKSYLGEFDKEYDEALRNAVTFGPWEQSVHITLAIAAPISWSSLSKKQKQIFASNIERGLVWSVSDIRSVLEAYRKRSVICAYLKRDEMQKRLCKV